MHKKIIWSSLAEKDFSIILNYLFSEWNSTIAYNFVDKTDELLHQISKNPKQFPSVSKKRGIRKCVISKHNTLYFRVNKNEINLLRIFDTRQNPNKLKI